jgi:hypothetical protein
VFFCGRAHAGARGRWAGLADAGRSSYTTAVITGAHFLIYSTNPDADRAFFRDVLDFRAVDAGGGWLIFALPPAELAVHPSDGAFVQRHADRDLIGAVLYLMCDDLRSLVESLQRKNVDCAPIGEAEWGRYTILRLPSGGGIGLYEPTHPSPLEPQK